MTTLTPLQDLARQEYSAASEEWQRLDAEVNATPELAEIAAEQAQLIKRRLLVLAERKEALGAKAAWRKLAKALEVFNASLSDDNEPLKYKDGSDTYHVPESEVRAELARLRALLEKP